MEPGSRNVGGASDVSTSGGKEARRSALHEITRLVILMDVIADHLGLEAGRKPALNELGKDVALRQVRDGMRERREWEKTKRSR